MTPSRTGESGITEPKAIVQRIVAEPVIHTEWRRCQEEASGSVWSWTQRREEAFVFDRLAEAEEAAGTLKAGGERHAMACTLGNASADDRRLMDRQRRENDRAAAAEVSAEEGVDQLPDVLLESELNAASSRNGRRVGRRRFSVEEYQEILRREHLD